MPVAERAFRESGSNFFEVESDEPPFVDFRVDGLVAVKAKNCRVSHSQLVGEGAR
jgi:hypothetical protein